MTAVINLNHFRKTRNKAEKMAAVAMRATVLTTTSRPGTVMD